MEKTDKRKCYRCGKKDADMDFCDNCKNTLCTECMKAGCCSDVPALSGLERYLGAC